MPKNVLTTIQLCLLLSKSFKLGLSGMWTKNFQMYKLDLEKADKPEANKPNYQHPWIIEKAREFRKASTSASLTTPKPLTVWITINCEKFFKRWEYQTTLPASWKTCHEPIVRTGHGTMDWIKTGKGECQGCILSPCLFNLYAEYIMQNARLEEAQAGIKIARRNINNLRYADDSKKAKRNYRDSWWRWKRRVKKLT